MNRGHAVALVGAMYGSEGKGLVAATLANDYDCHVRVGGPNAGHTFYHDEKKFVARSVPVGWINDEAMLYIGPGAVIDLNVLEEELTLIEEAGYNARERLLIDYRATVISRAQHLAEGGTSGAAHQAIGSTGEGVGMARMSRINRDTLISVDTAPYRHVRVGDHGADLAHLKVSTGDVTAELHAALKSGKKILLEGTQGSGLSLTLGPWPYCTSADTNAAQLTADCGISPTDVSHTILVARTFPIRVAGNSGPLYEETTWEELGFEPEITTVTKKVRRVGKWNPEQVRFATQVNFPSVIVVTFLDYLWPEAKGVVNWRALPTAAISWIEQQEELIEAPIIAVGTGPDAYCPLKIKAGFNGLPVYPSKADQW